MLISLRQVSKSFGGKPLFKDVSFQLNRGEKVGLIGRNGAGKTTLCRLISGDLEGDYGELNRHPHLRVGCMHQLVRVDSDRTVFEEAVSVFSTIEELRQDIENLEAEIQAKARQPELPALLDRYERLRTEWEILGGYSYKARSESALFGLGFADEDFEKRLAELSGGQLNRLNLARLLLSDPNLLLLDEPTNHLDISALRWLENFLRNYPHAFILISHDRYFLDATVNKILEISDQRVEEYPGNYSRYLEEREKRWRLRQKRFDEQREFIKRTEDFISRNIAGQNTKQAQSRRKMLQRLEPVDIVRRDESRAKFGFEVGEQSGELVLKVRDLEIGYVGNSLVRGISLSLLRGDRLGIVGPNGSGKTTLLRTILGIQPPLQGEIVVGRKVSAAFYEQQLSSLNPQLAVLEEMRSISPLSPDGLLRAYLARFLFCGQEVFQQVSSLSGGEKSRLVLAKLIFGKANTLVLDEPTNHLDIPSCEALESALKEFAGTLIIVSHDRYLLNKLVGRYVYLDGKGNSHHFEGSYRDLETSLAFRGRSQQGPESAGVDRRNANDGLEPLRIAVSKNKLNKLKRRFSEIEQEIHEIEERKRATSVQLSDPGMAKDFVGFRELSDFYQDLNEKLDQLYSEWEKCLELLQAQNQFRDKNPVTG